MTKVDLNDVQEAKAERDENGDLLPDTKTFEYEGETKEVDVLPVTGGLGNRLAKHQEGLEELEPKSVAAVLSVMCPDLEGITADDVEDMPLKYEVGLTNAVAEQMPETEIAEGN
jgi:hypothetical protein